jgi:hypothetical protein
MDALVPVEFKPIRPRRNNGECGGDYVSDDSVVVDWRVVEDGCPGLKRLGTGSCWWWVFVPRTGPGVGPAGRTGAPSGARYVTAFAGPCLGGRC